MQTWFSARREAVIATLGERAVRTQGMLSSLPLASVRSNIAAGLDYASGRGRDPWLHQVGAMAAIRDRLLDASMDPTALVVIPTGGGKTDIFVRTVEASGLDAGRTRLAVPTLILEPTRQLVDQTTHVFRDRFPALHALPLTSGDGIPGSVTILSYALFVDMVDDGRIAPEDVAHIVMDEAHRGLSDIRQDIIERFIGNTVVTAFSATPAFDNVKNIQALLGPDSEVCRISDERLRVEGIISPVNDYVLRTRIAGTLPADPEMRKRIVKEATANTVLDFVARHTEKGTGVRLRDKVYLGYTNGIARSAELASILTASGMRADSVSGRDTPEVIADKLGMLSRSDLQVLVNDQVLVEGTDVPEVRGVLAFEPTKSLVKHLQRCGRARRIDPSMDKFDPRQTSSIVEVFVEINGKAIPGQRIYAEAIGDLSVATIVEAPVQRIDKIMAAIARKEARASEPSEDTEEAAKPAEVGGLRPMTDSDRTSRERSPKADRAADEASPTDMPTFEVRFNVDEDVSQVHYLKGGTQPAPVPVVSIEPSLEWLTQREMANEAGVKRSKFMAFDSLWSRLADKARAGEPLVIDGRLWKGALVRCIRRRVEFCMHADESEALATIYGKPKNANRHDQSERDEEWVDVTTIIGRREQAEADNLKILWDDVLATETRQGTAEFEHCGLRFRRFSTRETSELYVHVDSAHPLHQFAEHGPRIRKQIKKGLDLMNEALEWQASEVAAGRRFP